MKYRRVTIVTHGVAAIGVVISGPMPKERSFAANAAGSP
jgi:hypothetical protein